MSLDEASQIATLRRWWKVIVISAVAGALAGFGTSNLLPDTYEASATMLVGSVDAGELAYDELLAAQLEAQTYAVLATANSTLQETILRTGLSVSPEELRRDLSVEAPASSRFVRITVSGPSPWASADTANAIAATMLIEPSGAEDRAALQEIETQIADLSVEAGQIEEEIDRLGDAAASPAAGSPLARLEEDLTENEIARRALLDQITELSNNALVLADPAARPVGPSAPRPLLNTVVAAVTGGILAAGVALTFGQRPRRATAS